MTRDDIIRMAKAADVWVAGQEPYQTQLERFAALVADEKDKEIAEIKQERRRDMKEIYSLREEEESLREENERLRDALTYDWDQLQACQESLREHMAEGRKLQIDAERYRWLKEYALAIDMGADPDNFVQIWVGTKMFRGRTLDDAVDEAMKQAALRQEEP